MNEDPGFAALWAIFPRKDRKIEARYEWRQAARRFKPDRIILAAAYYCAEMHGRARADILTASAWLKTVDVTDREQESYAAQIGSALVTLLITSRMMGHASLHGTARDYLAPHSAPCTPAQQFVLDVILKRPDEIIPDDKVGEYLAAVELPAL